MTNSSYEEENTCTALWEFPKEPAENFFSIINNVNQSARQLCLISAAVKLKLFDALISWQTETDLEKIIAYPHPLTDIIQSLLSTGLIEYHEGKNRGGKARGELQNKRCRARR